MTLAEIIKEFVRPGGPYHRNQEGLARDLAVSAATISKLKLSPPEWEAHFEFFLRLVEMMHRHGMQMPDRPAPTSDKTPPKVYNNFMDMGKLVVLLGVLPNFLYLIRHDFPLAKMRKSLVGQSYHTIARLHA